MQGVGQGSARLARRVIEAHYVEAMLLADEARGYFELVGRDERDGLSPSLRISFACESLKVTTRLMHVIAWLLTQRAVQAGEMTAGDALHPARRLGPPPESETIVVRQLPPRAQIVIEASIDLFARIARLEGSMAMRPLQQPVQALQERLALAF